MSTSAKIKSIGILEILLTIFITLKLIPGTEVNDWSWIWVLSPIWIGFALFVAVFIIAIINQIVVNIGKK